MAFCTLIFTFFVPECKGKSLEEVDLMFHERVPLRKFQSYKADVKLETAVQKEKDVLETVREV
jgi:hypothetical protein